MTTAYKTFSTKKTSQREAVPGKDMIRNRAGGFTFAVDKWAMLNRFLILGSDHNGYYVNAQTLTKENATNVINCIHEDWSRVLNTTLEISKEGRAPKNDPAIFVLALLAAEAPADVRHIVLSNLSAICRTSTHLFQFINFVQQFRGWGRSLKRGIQNWYLNKDADSLGYQVTKYRNRDGFSHRDVLRLSKPVIHNEHQLYNLIRFIVNKKYDFNQLPRIVQGYIKANEKGANIPQLIKDYKLTWEHLPTEALNDVNVWRAILPHMPLTATMRNLGKMTSIGLLKPFTEELGIIYNKFSPDNIKGAMLHPINVLTALKTYSLGRGIKGSLSWSPIPKIVSVLEKAFYDSFKNVEPTGKNILLALDVSESMGNSYNNVLTAREIAAAFAMTVVKTEQNYHTMAFSHILVDLPLTPNQSLNDVINITSKLNFGATNCALPMIKALAHQWNVDTFIIITDNDTWYGKIHPYQALQKYRQQINPKAKLLVLATESSYNTIADPNDAGMLDIVGFDSSVPQLIRDFIIN